MVASIVGLGLGAIVKVGEALARDEDADVLPGIEDTHLRSRG